MGRRGGGGGAPERAKQSKPSPDEKCKLSWQSSAILCEAIQKKGEL